MKKLPNCYKLLLLLIFSTVSHTNIQAQTLKNGIDSLIQHNFVDANGPGGVFMVAYQGKPIYQRAIGKSNLELGDNLSMDHVFQLGSMTKQFTAVSILLLEQQGKLKVTDLLSKYIADYPNGNTITIHHLLTHTSGIKDFTKMKSLSAIAQKEMTPKMMVDFFKNEEVDFLPGEQFEYNNSGYVVLGYLIELVSGETYENFVSTHIFKKIGMNQSYYASDRKVIQNRAYGYHKKESGYVNKTIINFSVPFSSGSLMSTAGDLLKWQNALEANLLLDYREKAKAFDSYKLNNGEPFSYGYGWHIKAIGGRTTYEHGGSIFGFKTMGIYFPSEDIYILGMTNCDCNSPTQLTSDIAALVIKLLGEKIVSSS